MPIFRGLAVSSPAIVVSAHAGGHAWDLSDTSAGHHDQEAAADGKGFSMVEDYRAVVPPGAYGTGEWTPEKAAQRHKARSQMLWMVDQARHAAKNQRVDDARWWREQAICALWNMT